MPLLHNHFMDPCSYVRKNTLLAAKGGCICTPLAPPKSATDCCFEVATVLGLSNCRKNITQLQTYRAEDHADGHIVQVEGE